MISVDDMNTMLLEAAQGKERTSVKGEEAAASYERLKAEVREALAKGYSIAPIAG